MYCIRLLNRKGMSNSMHVSNVSHIEQYGMPPLIGELHYWTAPDTQITTWTDACFLVKIIENKGCAICFSPILCFEESSFIKYIQYYKVVDS